MEFVEFVAVWMVGCFKVDDIFLILFLQLLAHGVGRVSMLLGVRACRLQDLSPPVEEEQMQRAFDTIVTA